MTTNDITTAAAQAVEAAEANLSGARTKARNARQAALSASGRCASLSARLEAGDATVDIDQMVEHEYEATRQDKLAAAHERATLAFEHALRVAHTDAAIAQVKAGRIKPRSEHFEHAKNLGAKIADMLQSTEFELEEEYNTYCRWVDSLAQTTAYGSGSRYKNGHYSSAIRVGTDGNVTIDGEIYTAGAGAGYALERILDEAKSELRRRRSDRNEPARLAALEARVEQARSDFALGIHG